MAISTIRRTALLVALVLGVPAAAQAQRKSPLADAPAIRHRLELRQKRAELGASIGTTLNQDFYHAVTVNIRAGFHFNDWLSLGTLVGMNVSPSMKTGFHEELNRALTGREANDKAPVPGDAERSMNKIANILALQLEATPFTGKYSLFGKLFMNYDLYAFLGPGSIKLESDEPRSCSDTSVAPSCNVSGFKVGANFGIGLHSFISQWIAVNVELRDILIRNNPAGRDVNGDRNANGDDISWDSNYLLTLGLVLFLPTSASISP